MLSAAKVPLFFWAEAIATACFTQNHSLVIPHHEKTPYHIINEQKPSVKFFYVFGSICYIVRDGENLDKMKEKGDECIFVGYSTQSIAYRVFNKGTRVIMESIHVNFDELPQMASDQLSSDPVPEYMTVTTSNELNLLFSLMFNELLNGSSKAVSKSFAVSTADAPNQRQHHTTPLNNHTTPAPTCQVQTLAPTIILSENINQAETYAKNDKVADDKCINIFSTSVQDQGETSSRHVDSLNMHTFYQQYPSEHQMITLTVRTRCQLESDAEMCMFTLTVSQTEPKNIKEAMADSAWIESMQKELYQFDRLDVWELVDRPLCTNVINLKWLWKNKHDEKNNGIRNKSRLVLKDMRKRKELILKNLSHPLLGWKPVSLWSSEGRSVAPNPRVQNVGNQNGLIGVQRNIIQNQIGNGNLVAVCAEGHAAGQNGNQIRCYNCRGIAEEYDLMAAAADLDEFEEVNANCILMANLQQASSSGTQTDCTPVYDSDESAENDNKVISEVTGVEQGEEIVEQHSANFEETRALYESLYHNLAVEVEKVNSVNRKLKETNADLTTELASTDKQIMTLNEQISDLNKQLSKEKSTVSFLLEEKKKLKSDFKTYEDKLLDKQIELEKKIKDLNNIVFKMGQSIQTINMLSPKPDSFYHTERKMALGCQNPFYLKQAQKKQQSLYDGKVFLQNMILLLCMILKRHCNLLKRVVKR
nr:hypothetical protein [Tanacetum cinerariifolium]